MTHGIILCTIQRFITGEEEKLQKFRKPLEDIYLNFITYLSFECNSPLRGYLQLKKYQIKTPDISLYFRLVAENLAEKLKFKSKQIQELQYIRLTQESYLEKINIDDIRISEELWDDLQPSILRAISGKINFWQQLIGGYARIEEYFDQTVGLSEKIWEVKDKLFENIKIDQMQIDKSLSNLNGMELRILSIIYSVILNDYYGVLEILQQTIDIEQKLTEILTFERNLQLDIILNTNLLNEEVTVLTVSILRSRGQILNKNRATLSNFFGYEKSQDFEAIQDVTQLMPDVFSQNHNKWIDHYIQNGHSKLFSAAQQVFYKDKKGLIHSANLRLSNLFDTSDDFKIAGSILKTKQNQSFLIVDGSGKILGLTPDLLEIFEGISLSQIMQKGYLMFWLNELVNQWKIELEEIQMEDSNHSSTTKTGFFSLFNNFEFISKEFEKIARHQGLFGDNMAQDFKTGATSKNTLTTKMVAQPFSQVEEQEEKYYLFGQEIPLLSQRNSKILENIQTMMRDYYQYTNNEVFIKSNQGQTSNQLPSVQFRYQVYYYRVGSDENKVGLLIYYINDLRLRESTHQVQHKKQNSSGGQLSSIRVNPESEYFNTDAEVDSDKVLSFSMNEPVINKLGDQIDESIEEKIKIQDQTINNQPDFIGQQSSMISPRDQKAYLLPNESKDKNYLESIEELDQDPEVEDDQGQLGIEAQRESSLKDKNKEKKDLLLLLNQNLNIKNNDGAHQSISSGTSDKTQNSIFHLIKILQYRQNIPEIIIKIYLINASISLAFICFILVKIILVSNNLSILKKQLSLIESPNQFNQMFCHFTAFSQMFYINHYNITSYNEYENYRLRDMSAYIRQIMNPVVTKSKNDFAIYQQNEQLAPVSMLRIEGYQMQLAKPTFFEFVFYFNQEAYQQNKLIQCGSVCAGYRQIVSSYTLRLNVMSELELSQNLLDAVYFTFYQNLNINQNTYTVLLCVEIILVITLSLLQIPLWLRNYLYQQKILLIIARAQIKDAEEQLYRLNTIKTLLSDQTNKWKQQNYHYVYFQSKYTSDKINKQQLLSLQNNQGRESRSVLTSRILESKFSYIKLYTLVVIQIFIISSSLIGLYIFTNSLNTDTGPQLNLSMDFVKFKFDFDNFNLLAIVIKSDPILEDRISKSDILTHVDGFNKTLGRQESRMLTQFSDIFRSLYGRFDQIYGQIISSSKISKKNKHQLLSLYQNDLCLSDQIVLPFCNFEKGLFTGRFKNQYPKPQNRDNYRQQIVYGMTGLVQNLLKTVTSAFSRELNDLTFDTDQTTALIYLSSKEFISLVWNYFIDLYQPFSQFEISINQAATDILSSDISLNTVVHISLCCSIVLTLQIILFGVLWRSSRSIRAIRQSLVNLPFILLLDPQTSNQIKRLEAD